MSNLSQFLPSGQGAGSYRWVPTGSNEGKLLQRNAQGGEDVVFDSIVKANAAAVNTALDTKAPVAAASNWNTLGAASQVAGMIGWKNYGNGHVVFDASAGASPSGSAVNSSNAASPWIAEFPTLMGWNGSQTFGVRVDSARAADSMSWKNFGGDHVIFDASAGVSPSGSAVNSSNASSPWIAKFPTLMGWNGSQTFGVRVDSARVADSATTAANATNADYATSAGSTANALTALAATTNGYAKIGGLIIQWGFVDAGATVTGSTSFSIGFPSAVLSVVVGASTKGYASQVTAKHNTGFSWNRGGTLSSYMDYIAIGY